MEPRKVIIIDSKNQSQKVINNSVATTLGELKREMREMGISYEGSTFYCGQMRAELKDDAAPLPEVVMYKGQEVRGLTFMLTTPDKKIKSGTMSRVEAYAEIKKKGLQDACVKKYGKNFTQCSTADLISLINTIGTVPAPKAEKSVEEVSAPAKKEESSTGDKNYRVCPEMSNITKAFKILLSDLYDDGTIEENTYDAVMTTLNGGSYNAPEKMSKKEIDEMFNFVDR